VSFSVCKDFRFAAAHQIRGHRGGCENLHGHSYRVRVWVRADALDALGMVVDFADLKAAMEEVVGPFDHAFLNEVPPFDERNTTAELLAQHVFAELLRRLDDGRVHVARVEVWESDSAGAVYEEDSPTPHAAAAKS
jgi:6-pyruvoyltetrahydropterin/6-carboxytetrahydropterin synthase